MGSGLFASDCLCSQQIKVAYA
uniref:Uncharacterized protein n=1 Tax=Anguilla anguilla TaxID=7936 RepID=A0A0E9S231_ANGAN